MSRETLYIALEKIFFYVKEKQFKEIHFIWHGGEPLLAGIDFFKYGLAILNRFAGNICCRHFIQSNGLLLDDEWSYFLRDMNIHVGISLDGPADIHDRFRVFENSSGTHAAVMEKLNLLKKHHVPAGLCAVASRAGKGREKESAGSFRI